MATIPDLDAVQAYLGSDHSWSDEELTSALASQVGDQAKKCKVPSTRTAEVTTTNHSSEITGTFLAADAGTDILADGVPEGTTIESVAEDLATATLSTNATANGTVTATLSEPWPDALVEALKRRTHVALSLKPLPLGIQVTLSDVNAAQTRVGSPSSDALVRDLELPYRKRVFG